MPLAPGTQLGSFEIVGLLGVGGMGEVYRARDTRLGRDVALKTLPDSVTGNPERLARFRREAQVLAARKLQPGAATWSDDLSLRQPFHLMLQPRLGFCSDDSGVPFNKASHAARRSLPLGVPRPGRLSSNCPR